jgi:hypothetical protein
MSESSSTSNSLVNFGDLTKPATVLIEKISDAIGVLYEPKRIRNNAKAEAEAGIIKAEGEIKITELQRRAFSRFLDEEAKKQKNIEDITSQAFPLLEDSSNPQEMENDWITNFFDKCRIISDTEMQQLWSKILAGEANSPGTYTKRTVNFLGSLDKLDALLFTKLCGFAWMFGIVTLFIFDEETSIYNDKGINFNSLTHLDSIGLINFNFTSGFRRLKLPKSFRISYYDSSVAVELHNEENNEIEIGKVLLTQTGQQLATLCGSQPVEGFQDYVLEEWLKKGIIVSSPFPRIEV